MQVYRPAAVEAATLLRAQVAGFSGLELGKLEKVYVSMHAQSQPGAQLCTSSSSLSNVSFTQAHVPWSHKHVCVVNKERVLSVKRPRALPFPTPLAPAMFRSPVAAQLDRPEFLHRW